MADELVTDYWINYLIHTNRIRVWVKTEESDWQVVQELPSEQAASLINMVLSGKQLYYVKGASLYMNEALSKS